MPNKKSITIITLLLPIYQFALFSYLHKSEFAAKHIVLCIYLCDIWIEG